MKQKNKYEHNCPMCQHHFTDDKAPVNICGDERPPRDVLCQLAEGHTGRHIAVIFWE